MDTAVMVAIVIQVAATVFYFGRMDSRVKHLEESLNKMTENQDRHLQHSIAKTLRFEKRLLRLELKAGVDITKGVDDDDERT